ncbi:uncharacterized protein LOC126398731 [Epinephelus moara]|uniref:uncharacterized protein LOC126398731 n=1 Tax=Epinephelus moara TaxID=300413 RepID=UPI00214F5309|nr:uncharacterized protein LOC126398731 [Epinephelus moara]
MIEFRWIKVSLLMILVLQFTAVAEQVLSLIVSVGDDVILPCDSVTDNQNNCDGTAWVVTLSGNRVEDLVKLGQIVENAKAKSDRLSVTENCSLVMKKVTAEDVGRYDCQQSTSGKPDTLVYLSVINMKAHENGDEVTLSCSTSSNTWCIHKVKWLYVGKNGDQDNQDMPTSYPDCSASVTFPTIDLKQKSKYQCEVTDGYTKKVQPFPFSRQSSSEKPGWWLYIIGAVGLVTVLIIIVAVIIWKRPKGGKTQMDDDTARSLNPAVTQPGPETSQETADPEDGVSYTSISYKKTKSKAQVKYDDDEGDAVTYSTVKVSSSAAGASADASDLYATVNEPNK